mgnify:FL=1
MKTSCAGAIRGLWDELNQGLFPWIEDNIGELDARHRLFMAVCEAVIRPREFDYAKWKGNGSADGTVRVPAPTRHERWRNRSARLPSNDLPAPAYRGFEITST